MRCSEICSLECCHVVSLVIAVAYFHIFIKMAYAPNKGQKMSPDFYKLVAKIVEGRYDISLVEISLYTESSRCNLFQLSRPASKNLAENFFFRTCRLSDVLSVHMRNTNWLKKRLLSTFWDKFHNLDERKK